MKIDKQDWLIFALVVIMAMVFVTGISLGWWL
jgi:hypothetical protein